MAFIRKNLSAEGLLETVRTSLKAEQFKPLKGETFSSEDCLMSGLAIFGLKYPSLLQFEKGKENPAIAQNLKNLYRVNQVPSDTSLRERLDKISPRQLRSPFKKIFSNLQRSKVLEMYAYLDGHYILSIDGTGQFSSETIHCKNCCEKNSRSGKTTYYHHLLGGCIVHPDKRVVTPLAPEPIVKSDGDNKNDCERNASKRFLSDFRREHPHLKVLVVEDALTSNYPHLSLLDSLKMAYVIGVKPGDHGHLFEFMSHSPAQTYAFETNEIGRAHV